jgi:hypothetical protein
VPLQWKAYMGGKVFVSFFLLGVDNGVWTQGLYLEPLQQPFYFMGFFETGSCELFDWAE